MIVDRKYLICSIVLGLIASLPLLLGIPYGLDSDYHYKIALYFYERSLENNLYPSWFADSNNGYGDVSVRFYPPGLYLLFSFAQHLTGNWTYAPFLSFILINVTGSIAMYLWVSQLTPKHHALFSIIFYLLAPFHTNQLYQGGMYGQYLGTVFLLFIFASVEYAINNEDWRASIYLGLSCAGLIICHIPSTMLGFVAIGCYTIIRIIQRFSYKAIKQLFIGLILGTLLSFFYLLPLLLEVKWKTNGGRIQGEWFDYKNQFLFNVSLSADSNFWLTQLFIFTLFILIPSIILLKTKNHNSLAPLVTVIVSLFMATKLSKPIWDIFPPLQEMQFPWRWLNIVTIVSPLLLSMSLSGLNSLRQTKWRSIVILLIGFPIISLSFTMSQVIRSSSFYSFNNSSQTINKIKNSSSYTEFLPIWAKAPTPMKDNLEISNRERKIIKWLEEEKVFQLSQGKTTTLRLKLFYYPYWKAMSEGKNLVCSYDFDGALLVKVPEQACTITVKFVEPLTTTIAEIVSLVTFLICGLLIFYLRKPVSYFVNLANSGESGAL